jgi:acetyl-CoA carboxylase carboxyltransferase component
VYDASEAAAGTARAAVNMAKIERVVALAVEHAWPFVCFADGGEEGPSDPGGLVPWLAGSGRIGLFDGLCELSGLAPTVALITGRSAGANAAVAMLSDFVVAVRGGELASANGAALAVEEHERRGDIDLVVTDDAAAIAAAREYLLYLAEDRSVGSPSPASASIDEIIPDNRRRAYDMRRVIDALADEGTVLELRPNWATSLITAFIRLEGRSVGLFANQPKSKIVGAIDADAADKMTRFIELCDAYAIPLLSLIDSPGFYIGQEAERQGIARHHVRTLSALEHRDVPLYCVQVRKAYGLGPLVMRGSWGHRAPDLRLAWPTVETGGMSLEGAAYLARRKEMLAAATPEEALAIRDEYANTLRGQQSGIRAAENFSFDDIVLPSETRERVIAMLRLAPRERRSKRTYLDTI